MWQRILATLHAWLSDLGPNRDAHNERIKLIAGSLNTIALSALIGGVISPLFTAGRVLGGLAVLFGVLIWLGFSFAAYHILSYTRSRE